MFLINLIPYSLFELERNPYNFKIRKVIYRESNSRRIAMVLHDIMVLAGLYTQSMNVDNIIDLTVNP